MATDKRTKRLERRHLEALAVVVNGILDDDFGGHDSKGAQTRFAKKLGVSQSHISQMSRGGNADRGVGLPVLIAIRDYLREMGRAKTIDEILGLDGATGGSTEIGRLAIAVEGIVARLGTKPAKLAPPPPPSSPRARQKES